MKKSKFILQMATVTVASALVLTGCASHQGNNGDSGKTGESAGKDGKSGDQLKVADADFAETPYDQVKDGGVLKSAIYEIPEQENVFHADSTVPSRVLWNWYNPIMALYDAQGNYKPNPDYLTDVKEDLVNGHTVVTYTIRKEATWNDGTPIDWTAFETTWKINNGKDKRFIPNSTDGYERITSVKPGANPKIAVVTFDGPYPWWQGLFNSIAHPALANPKNYFDYLKKVHPEWGAGPYTVDHVDFNKGEAVFVRNPKWWGPKGKLDKRIYVQMKDQAEVNAFKNGEIDYTGLGNRERYATLKNLPGIDIRVGRSPSTSLFMLNAKAPALKDIAVRKAIAEGIDRVQLEKIQFNGLPYTENPPGSLVLFPWQKGYQDNYSKAVQFNVDAAKKTLEDAGYKPGPDGIREKDGKPLAIRYALIGEDPVSKAQAIAVQKMMENIGIKVNIDTRPASDFSNLVTHRDFEILPLGFSSSDPFGVAYFGQTYLSDSNLNLSGTGDAELDKKIRELQSLPTQAEQIKRANELEVEAFKRYGLIPFSNGPSIVGVKKDLVNVGAFGFASVPIENIGWKK